MGLQNDHNIGLYIFTLFYILQAGSTDRAAGRPRRWSRLTIGFQRTFYNADGNTPPFKSMHRPGDANPTPTPFPLPKKKVHGQNSNAKKYTTSREEPDRGHHLSDCRENTYDTYIIHSTYIDRPTEGMNRTVNV